MKPRWLEKINIEFWYKYRIWINFQMYQVKPQEHRLADLRPPENYRPVTCSQGFPRRWQLLMGGMTEEVITRPLKEGFWIWTSLLSLPSSTQPPSTVTIHQALSLGNAVPFHDHSHIHILQRWGRWLQRKCVLWDEHQGVKLLAPPPSWQGLQSFYNSSQIQFYHSGRLNLSRRIPDSWEKMPGYSKMELKVIQN